MTPGAGIYDGPEPDHHDDHWPDDVIPEDPDPWIPPIPEVDPEAEPEPINFWQSRPVFAHLHQFAQARMVGPWAVLGATLARIIANTPPYVVLPATIGSLASLNLFIGLVGRSGSGKNAAQSVARDALQMEENFNTNPLGSGEGLSHMFMRNQKGEDEPVQYNQSALVTVGEIDTLGALVQRQSSTVTSQLRQAAMGEALGFFYVDTTKRMLVPEHAYRMTLVAGIQPARSQVLLGESDGGTPQRFVWLPVGDPSAPDDPPPEPPAQRWSRLDWTADPKRKVLRDNRLHMVAGIPDSARKAIISARQRANRNEDDPDRDPLEGHALLTRTKVAVALAILDGRMDATEEDWMLAGIVMRVSDGQRQRCQETLVQEMRKANAGQALAEADRVAIVQERTETEAVQRAVKNLRKHVLQAGEGGITPGVLNNKLSQSLRGQFGPALDVLIKAGAVRVDELNGVVSKVYAE